MLDELTFSEAVMISSYCQRLVVNHIRKLKRVHKCAGVYLNIKPNRLSKGGLYCKFMQYGFNFSTKHPSATYNNFENYHLKSIIFV